VTTIRENAADKLLSVLASGELLLRTKPHIVVVRTAEGAARYFGPFPGLDEAREAADSLDDEAGPDAGVEVEVVPLFPA
jgi:hypothetical protein